MMREGFLGSDTQQGDKVRGRGDQLSRLSPPGFILNVPHFHSLSVFPGRRVGRQKLPPGGRSSLFPRLCLGSCSFFDPVCLFLLTSPSFNSFLSCSYFIPSTLSKLSSLALSYFSSSNFPLHNFLIPVSVLFFSSLVCYCLDFFLLCSSTLYFCLTASLWSQFVALLSVLIFHFLLNIPTPFSSSFHRTCFFSSFLFPSFFVSSNCFSFLPPSVHPTSTLKDI